MFSVLHADGDRKVRDTYAQLLASRGIPSRASGGGVDSLYELREQPPGLLILDLELPWGGGLGVLDVMREEPGLRQIPVVITSAVASVEKLNQLTVMPVVRSYSKPFRLTELLATTVGLRNSKAHDTGSPSEPNGETPPITESLASRLEREIQVHTGRRVQNLRVDCLDGALLVRGRVRGYYVKQMVLVAAKRILQGSGVESRFAVDVE